MRNYLGALPADERQEILQSIESHIYDALENRSDGEPTAALLDAVIAEQFDPKLKSWRGDLLFKELSFLPTGKTDRLYWTWRDRVLHHSGDNTDAQFLIKKIGGKEYLFLEWISGDVIHRGLPPKYYVLKKKENP